MGRQLYIAEQQKMTLLQRKLALGSVQFGTDYGVANTTGQTPEDDVRGILEKADATGIRVIDTAHLYGQSEAVLGQTLPDAHKFNIVTKTPSFPHEVITAEDAAHLETAFKASLLHLKAQSIYGLMVHHADDLLKPGSDALYKTMHRFKQNGHVQKIGVSVYDAAQIDAVLARYEIDLIQVPVNIFDQRLIHSGHLETLHARGVEIHTRSTFLQGVLLMEVGDIPARLNGLVKPVEQLTVFCRAHGLSRMKAALGFVMNLEAVTSALCGVNTLTQFEEVLACSENMQDISMTDMELLAVKDPALINPALWP